MTNFVRQPGTIAIHMHVRKLEQLLEREQDPLKREMIRKILKQALIQIEKMGA